MKEEKDEEEFRQETDEVRTTGKFVLIMLS